MPTDAERAEALQSIPLFAGLPQAARQRIVEIAGELEASAGQVLVQPKTAGSGMYVVEEGTVAVERDGRTIELGAGQFFGELALLTDTLRTARVRAKTDARLLAIGRDEFKGLVESEPGIALVMLEVLAKRLAG
ncbi:MAG TPA: cyclic nucleotide-binding domain-containing protein [Actinomycetota bacterium]|nr:cyclic nucleotide-binding domain-containing protein [Actinomycetota bacterium]